ncbi:hypothetical protein SK128_002427 [Halocaridina rubra]|uniref:Transcription termination factor 5, mitochondrial n=1 Tax=Halocaridina rubra TaxID=373956 RepID=A0AAN8WPN4_HALRR
MTMSHTFQCISSWGYRFQKKAIILNTCRFIEAKWYTKTQSQESPEEVSSSNPKFEKLSLNTEARLPLLSEFFGISKGRAHELMKKEPRLQEVHKCDLFRNIQTLKKYGIDPDEVRKNLQLLYFCPLTVEHRVAILNELGFKNLSAYHCRTFSKLYKSTFSLLRTYKLVSSTYDVTEVLSSLNTPRDILDDFKLPRNLDDLTVSEVHRMLSFTFLCWYFDCEQDSVDYIYNIYPPTQVKSMSLQKAFFEKLKNHWNFDNEEIRKHGFLLCGSPTNLELIEENVKHLVGVNPRTVVHYTPRILLTPYHKLCQIVNMLMDINISQAAVLQNPNIFTLQPQTIKERIEQLQETPEFSGLLSHPRVLRLIYFSTKAKHRLDVLRVLKDSRSIPSLNILTGDQEKFENYVAFGYLRTNRRDIVTFLSKELSVDSSIIRKSLRIPSHKLHLSLVSVKKNIAYLYEKGFSREQVLMCLETLLYPHEVVTQQFQLLRDKMKSSLDKDITEYPMALQFLLYFMDKDIPY